MSALQAVRAELSRPLAAALEDILLIFGKTISQYERKICALQQENRHKAERPDAMLDPAGRIAERPDAMSDPAGHTSGRPGAILDSTGHKTKQLNAMLDSAGHQDEPLDAMLDPAALTKQLDAILAPPGHRAMQPDAMLEPAGHRCRRPDAMLEPAGEDQSVEEPEPAEGTGSSEEQSNSRHKSFTEEEEEDEGEGDESAEEKKLDKNTIRSTNWAVNTLRDFLKEKRMNVDLATYSAASLNDTLRLFYASVQTTKGEDYSVSSFLALRAGINRSVAYNIMADTEFKSCNAVFKSLLRKYRKQQKGVCVHHVRIPDDDLETLRTSPALSPDTAPGLVRKVWFDTQLCLARRGRGGNRELTPDSFVVKVDDSNGLEYVTFSHEAESHGDGSPDQKDLLRGVMYAAPGDPLCPVHSFNKYLSKCPKNAKSFFLHPRRAPQFTLNSSQLWYTTEPMGVHFLGNLLKKICEEVGLPRSYTNHSLRVTAVHRLTEAGLGSRDVLSVAGHHSEHNLPVLWAPSLQERRAWGHILISNELQQPPPEQQGWSPCLGQEEPEPPHIKEEEEEFPVKIESDEECAHWSQLHHPEENREAEPVAGTSTQQVEVEADPQDPAAAPICTGSETEDSDEGRVENRQAPSGSSVGQELVENVPFSLLCKVCKKPFSSRKYLMQHVRLHAEWCGLCGKHLEPPENLELHLESHKTCGVCAKRFCSVSKLERHMMVHSGEKPFRCLVCGGSFCNKSNLQKHLRSHGADKPFSCSVCGRRFHYKFCCKVHMRRHTGEKPFGCSICGRRFAVKGSLTEHMALHTGEKPLSCSVCGKRFSRSGRLKLHLSLHTGTKAFICSVCGRSFDSDGNLRRHMRSHTK